MKPNVPLFEENASATLARVEQVFKERGIQYGDTWRNGRWLALRAVYKKLTGEDLQLRLCRALASAALVDIKYQRMEGGFREDSFLDGINYAAFLLGELAQLESVLPHDSKCAACNGEGWIDNALCPSCRRVIHAPNLPKVPAAGRSV